MTDTTPGCPECGRPLLISADTSMCCYRHCGAYGQTVDVADDTNDPTPTAAPDQYRGEWLLIKESIDRIRKQQHAHAA